MLSGKHAGEEQDVIANVFAHLALAVEGRRRAVDGVGFEQHLAYIVQRTSVGIADLEQLLALAELCQDISDVVLHFGIAEANLTVEMVVNQFGEQLLQWVRFRYHGPFVPFLRGQLPAMLMRVLNLILHRSKRFSRTAVAFTGSPVPPVPSWPVFPSGRMLSLSAVYAALVG